MSFQALGAISGVDTPSAAVTLLLYVLAQYAGPDGACYPSLATIADDMRGSVSAARNALRHAEECGLLKREKRSRKDGGQSSNRIQLLYFEPKTVPDDDENPGGRRTPKVPKQAKSVSHPPPESGGGPTGIYRGPLSDSGGAFLNQSLNLEVADAPSASGRAIDDVVREVWSVWPAAGRDHSSERLVTDAVASEIAAGADLAEVRAGALAYAARPASWGSSGSSPKSPHLFFTEGRWKTHADGGRLGKGSPGCAVVFAGPGTFRAEFVATHGKALARSYLDPCGWRDEDLTILARTGAAETWLRDKGYRVERLTKAEGVR